MSVGGKCRHGFIRIRHVLRHVLDKSARWSLGKRSARLGKAGYHCLNSEAKMLHASYDPEKSLHGYYMLTEEQLWLEKSVDC